MAITTTAIQGYWYLQTMFKGKGKTWGEKYHLKSQTSIGSALTGAASLVLARRLILANDIKVDWARISKMDTSRDRRAVITIPVPGFELDTEVDPNPDLEDCNDIKSCLHVAYETAEGQWNNRFFRGLRDSWVTGAELQFTPTKPGAAVTDLDFVTGKTKEVALGNFLEAVMQFDEWTRPSPTDVTLIQRNSWINWAVIGMTSRDTGASWRAGRGRSRAS